MEAKYAVIRKNKADTLQYSRYSTVLNILIKDSLQCENTVQYWIVDRDFLRKLIISLWLKLITGLWALQYN